MKPETPKQRPSRIGTIMSHSSQLIILEGPSGSGKSSLSCALQEALLPKIWLSFSMDTLIYTLPPSVLHRCNTLNDWSGVDGRAIGAAALRCLRVLIECGNNVIFDLCLPSRPYADVFQSEIKDLSPVVVGVRCAWQEIERRTLDRADRTIEEAERTFKNQHAFQRYDLVIDTTELSPEAAAAEYLTSVHHLLDCSA